jgi:hypothetical protein
MDAILNDAFNPSRFVNYVSPTQKQQGLSVVGTVGTIVLIGAVLWIGHEIYKGMKEEKVKLARE